MKFLVINKHVGKESTPTPEELMSDGDYVKELLEKGVIEAAYTIIAGGHIYIFEAKDTEELSVKIRHNRKFGDRTTEIIPIADTQEFIDGHIKVLKQGHPK